MGKYQFSQQQLSQVIKLSSMHIPILQLEKEFEDLSSQLKDKEDELEVRHNKKTLFAF